MENLKTAYSDLRTVSSSSTDGKIAAKRANLRALVNGDAKAIVNDKAKYTTDSYNKFNSYLTVANKVLKDTDSTLSEVTEAYDNLKNSIPKDLVLLTDTQEYKDALALLNSALDRASKLSSKDSYTEASYNTYDVAYKSAPIDYTH